MFFVLLCSLAVPDPFSFLRLTPSHKAATSSKAAHKSVRCTETRPHAPGHQVSGRQVIASAYRHTPPRGVRHMVHCFLQSSSAQAGLFVVLVPGCCWAYSGLSRAPCNTDHLPVQAQPVSLQILQADQCRQRAAKPFLAPLDTLRLTRLGSHIGTPVSCPIRGGFVYHISFTPSAGCDGL